MWGCRVSDGKLPTHQSMLEWLFVQIPTSINQIDGYGWPPIMYGIRGGRPEVVDWLEDHGADSRAEYGVGERLSRRA